MPKTRGTDQFCINCKWHITLENGCPPRPVMVRHNCVCPSVTELMDPVTGEQMHPNGYDCKTIRDGQLDMDGNPDCDWYTKGGA